MGLDRPIPNHGVKFLLGVRTIIPASAYTEAPSCKTVSHFFHFIEKGDCVPRGQGGTPLVISHGLYNTAYQFAKDKFSAAVSPNLEFLEIIFSRFMEGKNPTNF